MITPQKPTNPVRLHPQEANFLRFLAKQPEIAEYTFAFRTRSFRYVREMVACGKKQLLVYQRRTTEHGRELVIRMTDIGAWVMHDETILDPTP